MKKLCEAEYTNRETGHVRICQKEPPYTSDRVIGGLAVCDVCFEDMVASAQLQTAASRKTILVAFGIYGKKGRGLDSKVGKALLGAAAKKSGMSQREIDEAARAASRKAGGGE